MHTDRLLKNELISLQMGALGGQGHVSLIGRVWMEGNAFRRNSRNDICKNLCSKYCSYAIVHQERINHVHCMSMFMNVVKCIWCSHHVHVTRGTVNHVHEDILWPTLYLHCLIYHTIVGFLVDPKHMNVSTFELISRAVQTWFVGPRDAFIKLLHPALLTHDRFLVYSYSLLGRL